MGDGGPSRLSLDRVFTMSPWALLLEGRRACRTCQGRQGTKYGRTVAVPMLEILLVDDSQVDVQIMQEALEGTRVISRLHTVRDGVEAMGFLRREGTYAGVPRPGLILLDVNMPRKGGLEVLA